MLVQRKGAQQRARGDDDGFRVGIADAAHRVARLTLLAGTLIIGMGAAEGASLPAAEPLGQKECGAVVDRDGDWAWTANYLAEQGFAGGTKKIIEFLASIATEREPMTAEHAEEECQQAPKKSRFRLGEHLGMLLLWFVAGVLIGSQK